MSAGPKFKNYTVEHPEQYVTKDESLVRELLHPSVVPALKTSLAEAVVKAGQSTVPHRHMKTDEIYYCLEGQGELFINGQSLPFAPGKFYLIPKNSLHHLKASTALRLLCICTPPYSHEDTRTN